MISTQTSNINFTANVILLSYMIMYNIMKDNIYKKSKSNEIKVKYKNKYIYLLICKV